MCYSTFQNAFIYFKPFLASLYSYVTAARQSTMCEIGDILVVEIIFVLVSVSFQISHFLFYLIIVNSTEL